MRILILLLGLMLIFAGCATTGPGTGNGTQNQTPPPPSNTTPPANVTPPSNATMTCAQYCPTQPHIQCVGAWNISGTYPGCVCGFVCATPDETQNPEPTTNTTPPEGPLATPTNKTVKELMNHGLNVEQSEFYKTNDGSFTERTYTWERRVLRSDGITFDLAPASDILFDDEPIPSILASGFIAFENNDDGTESAYAVAIFNESSTRLDGYTGSDAFDIDYFPPMIEKDLRDCFAYTKDYNMDANGGWLLTYYIKCERTVDK